MDITLIGIFLEGILSFLSPCVLPLLPLYMSYLAGEDKDIDENGNVKYKTGKVFITTIFFVLGICFTLTLLAVSVNFIKQFIEDYSDIISIVFGTVLIIFGLHEFGIIHIDVLDSDSRFKVKLNLKDMNFFKAFLLGFIFSLGWSPCIGPMLANALMLAATSATGIYYIVAYGLGLVIPFLITGLLTSTILNFINTKKNIMKYILKVAGVIMICFGMYMIYNASSSIIQYKNKSTDQEKYFMNYEFEDQYGNTVKLSDYKGKYVMLNFTATWCTYCASEAPDYLQYSKSQDEVVCLYVMCPQVSYCSKDDIKQFALDNYELTTIIDETGELSMYCGIQGYPTLYVISPDSKLLGYASGALNVEMFNNILESAKQKINE